MAQLQVGDKYQVVFNGAEFVAVWTDDAIASGVIVTLGVNPLAGLKECYVNTDNVGIANGLTKATGYTSLNDAEAANFNATSANLVSEQERVICYCSGVTEDTLAVALAGFTTDETYFITITNPDFVQTPDIAIDTGQYRLSVTGPIAVDLREDYTVFNRIQIVSSDIGIRILNTSNTVTIENCKINPAGIGISVRNGVAIIKNTIISRSGALTNDAGIYINGASLTTIENSIIKGAYNHGLSIQTGTCNIYHSIIDGASDVGIRVYSGITATIKNNAIFNSAGSDISSLGTATIDYNASDDETGDHAVTHAGTGWDDEFEDPDNGDYTLKNTGNLFHAGTPIAGITTDITGSPYNISNPSIGASEYTSIIILFSGDMEAEADIQGEVDVERLFSGDIDAEADIQGEFDVEKLFSGDIEAEADIQGLISAGLSLSGDMESEADIQGEFDVERLFSGGFDGIGINQGTISVLRSISASVDGVGDITGLISVKRLLEGDFTAEADMSGDIGSVIDMIGNISAEASFNGDMSYRKSLIGDISGVGNIEGQMTVSILLSGDINAVADIIGYMTVIGDGSLGIVIDPIIYPITNYIIGASTTNYIIEKV